MKKEFYNKSDTAAGLAMLRCGWERCEEPFYFSHGNADGYELFCVLEGNGRFEADSRKYSAVKGDLFVFRPGTKVTYSSEDKDFLWTLCWIAFAGYDAEFYLSEAGITANGVYKNADVKGFAAAVNKCLDVCGSEKSPPSQATVNAILLEAFSSLKPQKAAKVRLRASEQAEKALNFIEHNYMRGITARDVTAALNIDRTHFFRIFKAKTGVSPEQYILRFRIGKAKELLASTKYTVTEVASFVGVNDVYYFSKLFKRSEGITPTEYRKAISDGE
ncbi:MAG: helix-turn-helix domain-containing protein [Clostridia bacterium]|nr:helix-turn-helix domain-containing protein [Clostridia bacterium]